MMPLLIGEFTVQDAKLYDYMRKLLEVEVIFLEPSAGVSFRGVITMNQSVEIKRYLEKHGLTDKMKDVAHIVWATGGSLVSEKVREEYKNTYLAPAAGAVVNIKIK